MFTKQRERKVHGAALKLAIVRASNTVRKDRMLTEIKIPGFVEN